MKSFNYHSAKDSKEAKKTFFSRPASYLLRSYEGTLYSINNDVSFVVVERLA